MIEDYQTVTIELVRGPSRDRWHEPVAGTGGARETLPATYASRRRLVRTQTGEEIMASGVFGLAPGVVIGPEDRIIYQGREHRPVDIVRPRSLDGEESTRVFVV